MCEYLTIMVTGAGQKEPQQFFFLLYGDAAHANDQIFHSMLASFKKQSPVPMTDREKTSLENDRCSTCFQKENQVGYELANNDDWCGKYILVVNYRVPGKFVPLKC